MKVTNRFEIQLNCPNFEFTYFPFDNQNCSIVLRGPNKKQNVTLINDLPMDKDGTKEDFKYESLNLQYEIESTELDISAAKDSTSYVGITLKFKRYFPPFFK